MPWWVYLWMGLYAITPILATALIGKPRDPYTPAYAIFCWFYCSAAIYALYWLATT